MVYYKNDFSKFMKNLLILPVLLLCGAFVFGQDFNLPAENDYPKITASAQNVNDFVPKKWKIVAKAFGDLNKDKTQDCVLVIQGTDTRFFNKNDGLGADVYDTNLRVLLVLFKDAAKNRYTLAKQSNSFIKIPDAPTMSEPFQSVKVQNGVLQLDFEQWYSAGSWAANQMSYKFRFQDGEFVLIGADKTESARNTGETETRSYNFLTGKAQITTGNFDSKRKKKVVWKTYKLDKLKTLDTFKEPYGWEIEYDYYI